MRKIALVVGALLLHPAMAEAVELHRAGGIADCAVVDRDIAGEWTVEPPLLGYARLTHGNQRWLLAETSPGVFRGNMVLTPMGVRAAIEITLTMQPQSLVLRSPNWGCIWK